MPISHLFRPVLGRSRIWLLLPILPVLLAARGSGDADLDAAVSAHDTEAIVARMIALTGEDPIRALRAIPEAYTAMEKAPRSDFWDGDRYRVFMTAVNCLGRIGGEKLARQYRTLFEESRSWPARFVMLHGALQNRDVDAAALALTAIEADEPPLVALAARILANTAEAQMLDPLVEALERWESRDVRERVVKGREAIEQLGGAGIAWVACRDALEKLTGQSLYGAADYAGYIKAHRGRIDPKNLPEKADRAEAATGVGLFGLDVTGRRIVFILDISGSMEATDPPTPEQLEELRRGLTGVPGDDTAERELMEQRRRILRAKKELTRVVEALPEDRRFNLVVYSTEVEAWKDGLVRAEPDAKERATDFIEKLSAKGVTVTDDALERAFADPMIDTIYLITDGAPTHIGSSVPGAMPKDSRELMQRILQDTRAGNYLRQVRIFTLGFQGAEVEFLKQLSAENHGRFHTIE